MRHVWPSLRDVSAIHSPGGPWKVRSVKSMYTPVQLSALLSLYFILGTEKAIVSSIWNSSQVLAR